jgi:hypothetical protein
MRVGVVVVVASMSIAIGVVAIAITIAAGRHRPDAIGILPPPRRVHHFYTITSS